MNRCYGPPPRCYIAKDAFGAVTKVSSHYRCIEDRNVSAILWLRDPNGVR